jgi:hypothetical protein
VTSIGCQHEPPELVCLTVDGVVPDIERTLDAAWPRVAAALKDSGRTIPRLVLAQREHQGVPMLNQVRNNGFRALDQTGGLHDDDLVVILDGDTLLHPDTLRHHRLLRRRGADLILPYRINLTEDETRATTPEDWLAAETAAACAERWLSTARVRELQHRQRRYEWHLTLKRLPVLGKHLVKPHKPKIIGGHHAVGINALRAVNGFDEHFTHYGYNDDELGRRLHASGARVAVAVDRALAFHLWHPSRAPDRPVEAPGYARFASNLPVVAENGWRTPREQPDLHIREYTP